MNTIYAAVDFLRRWRGLWLILAAAVLYTSVVCVICRAVMTPRILKQAEARFQEELTAYIEEQEEKAKEQEDQARAIERSEENRRKRLADMLAVALYAFRFNSVEDIITACWCFFNRVDITTGEYAYLSTLEEVIAQPGQWMGYDPNNPVLDDLRKIAYEQLKIWLDGESRPVSAEFVFLVWSESEIYLKDSLTAKHPHTWRYRGGAA